MRPMLTVFTPTYNRKETLQRTYESLCRQTCDDFLWLIIDDGSTDGTEKAVKEWMENKNKFEIRYCLKENGGLHTGYNKAIELADTELMVCIDSDDFMPDNAVELICRKWRAEGNGRVAGIIGLDYYLNGDVVGNRLPETKTLNLNDVAIGRIDVHGDKKQVVRTELFKEGAPMATFPGEKNFNPYYMIQKIGRKYEFLVLNENLCFVDYQQGGMTSNQWKQYVNSPRSFAEIRKQSMQAEGGKFSYYFKQCIHYVSSSILAKNKSFIGESPKKIMTVCAIPFGIALTAYIKRKVKKG